MHRTRLRAAMPCDVPYASMSPAREGRHCGACDREVVDLSALSERQAIALYRARGGDLCGYVVHDGRGEPVFRPEPRAAVGLGVLVAGALAACDAQPAPSAPAPLVQVSGDEPDAAGAAPFVMLPLSDLPVEAEVAAPLPTDASATISALVTTEAALPEAADEAAAPCEPTEEDRALERRKRARRRRPVARPPHTAFAGMMMLDD